MGGIVKSQCALRRKSFIKSVIWAIEESPGNTSGNSHRRWSICSTLISHRKSTTPHYRTIVSRIFKTTSDKWTRSLHEPLIFHDALDICDIKPAEEAIIRQDISAESKLSRWGPTEICSKKAVIIDRAATGGRADDPKAPPQPSSCQTLKSVISI
uniref:Uncharacterized protein n=1 Tax=Wuchereria bancrofti TaxID=6293 RepID=A0A1I8EIQ0_WUCBA